MRHVRVIPSLRSGQALRHVLYAEGSRHIHVILPRNEVTRQDDNEQ